MNKLTLEVDQANDLAYVTLSDHAIVRTVEHAPSILVDLDDMNVAVGIELLDLDAVIPFDELTTSYHVASSTVGWLRIIQPTINKFVTSSVSTKHDDIAPDLSDERHGVAPLV